MTGVIVFFRGSDRRPSEPLRLTEPINVTANLKILDKPSSRSWYWGFQGKGTHSCAWIDR